MRVGIITAHWAHNFGAMLQAFALQRTVEKLGHSCEIIDFMTAFQEKHQRLFPPSRLPDVKSRLGTLRQSLLNVWSYRTWKNRGLQFERFKDEFLNLTKRRFRHYQDLLENCPSFDAYICGSDQIWRSIEGSTTRFDPSYYLCFVRDESVRRIAYAPSFGADYVPEEMKEEYRRRISAIPFVSARERQGQRIIEELTGRVVPVVLDPTLLLSSLEWWSLVREPDIGEPYILVYFLGGDTRKMAHMIGQVKEKVGNLPVVALTISAPRRIPHVHFTVSDAHPLEFLGWISRATCVCTSSFHGMVFSFIFRRPFYAVMPHRISSRLTSLATLLHLESRLLIDGMKIPDSPLDVDFSSSEDLYEKELMKSLHFLRTALGVARS